MKNSYTQSELDDLLNRVKPRHGWDFSSMNVAREDVPWDYIDEVKKYLNNSQVVLDIGTGGGERFLQLSQYFKKGVGIDIDPHMIEIARHNGEKYKNIFFFVSEDKLVNLNEKFDVIINRHAPFSITDIKKHLNVGGYFITQQVGELNMRNVKIAIGDYTQLPPVSRMDIENAGLACIEFKEYNVEYVVNDIESLVFWLNALDLLHADIVGSNILKSADTLNRILHNNVDSRGFVTNEHRYLVVAKFVH